MMFGLRRKGGPMFIAFLFFQRVKSTNPSFGKTVSWLQCYLEGEYNRDRKVNCLMEILADRNYSMEWYDVWPQEEGGTDVYRILVFFKG